MRGVSTVLIVNEGIHLTMKGNEKKENSSGTMTKSTGSASPTKTTDRRGALQLFSSSPTTTATTIHLPCAVNSQWPVFSASTKSLRTTNPIRAVVDPIVAGMVGKEDGERSDGKDHISLALGDPTAAGHLPPCPVAVRAAQQALTSPPHAAGYVNACGTPEARRAVARCHSSSHHAVDPDHVVVASGCSGALELALTAALEQDGSSVLLVPSPGFPLYRVIAESHGCPVAPYRLRVTSEGWQVDVEHLDELLLRYGGSRNPVIVVNNPSNPTGAVFSVGHLRELIRLCDRHHVPVVADEVYGDMTFAGRRFHPLAEVAASMGRTVPVVTASGLGKQYLIPGWRVGWIVFQDNVFGSLREVEAGAKRLAQVILGASHLAQSVIPALLQENNVAIQEWKLQLRRTLETQGSFLCRQLAAAPGLQVMKPGGAMYAMVRIDTEQFDESIQNEIDFTRLLLQEENVFVLPGSCFDLPYAAFRVVFCAPVPVLRTAADRIVQFCSTHRK